jgi:ribonuclease HI
LEGAPTGIIYFLDEVFVSFSARLGHATNNLSELMALKLILHLAQEKGISNIYIYGTLFSPSTG